MKIKKIKLPVLKTEIWFCITRDVDEAKRWYKRNRINIDNWPDSAQAHTWTFADCFPVVYLPGLKTRDDIAAMCHEITHAVWYVLNDVHIKIEVENHEVLTYHQSYIIKELLK